jgi:hypothetical protein
MFGYISRDQDGVVDLSYDDQDIRSFVIYDVDEGKILTPCSMTLRRCLLQLVRERYVDSNVHVRIDYDPVLESYGIENFAILPLCKMAQSYIEANAVY